MMGLDEAINALLDTFEVIYETKRGSSFTLSQDNDGLWRVRVNAIGSVPDSKASFTSQGDTPTDAIRNAVAGIAAIINSRTAQLNKQVGELTSLFKNDELPPGRRIDVPHDFIGLEGRKLEVGVDFSEPGTTDKTVVSGNDDIPF